MAVVSFGAALSVAIRGELMPIALVAALAVLLAMPFVVAGLCMAQRPRIATIGQAGALTFAAACPLGAFVVLYALVAGIGDATALPTELGGLVWAAQAAFVPGGVAFGAASYVRRFLPRWACGSFVLGLLLVIPTLGTPAGFQLVVLGLVDLGILGMGLSLLPIPPPRRHARRAVAADRDRRGSDPRSGPRPLVPGV
jgi:hypothetical protein